MGIDDVGVDEVGIDEVGVDEVCFDGAIAKWISILFLWYFFISDKLKILVLCLHKYLELSFTRSILFFDLLNILEQYVLFINSTFPWTLMVGEYVSVSIKYE